MQLCFFFHIMSSTAFKIILHHLLEILATTSLYVFFQTPIYGLRPSNDTGGSRYFWNTFPLLVIFLLFSVPCFYILVQRPKQMFLPVNIRQLFTHCFEFPLSTFPNGVIACNKNGKNLQIPYLHFLEQHFSIFAIIPLLFATPASIYFNFLFLPNLL